MKIAVSNSGPLIHLTKAGLISYLFKLFDKIYIPEAVHEEVVIRGKEKGHLDAFVIEEQVVKKLIEIKPVKLGKNQLRSKNLHEGELEAIYLAKNMKVKPVLLDEEEARTFARNFNLNVKGTLGILIDLFKFDFIEFEDALHYLRKINDIMFLSSDVYQLVVDKIEKIQQTKQK